MKEIDFWTLATKLRFWSIFPVALNYFQVTRFFFSVDLFIKLIVIILKINIAIILPDALFSIKPTKSNDKFFPAIVLCPCLVEISIALLVQHLCSYDNLEQDCYFLLCSFEYKDRIQGSRRGYCYCFCLWTPETWFHLWSARHSY